ncbi:metallophosphoesterase family protein [Pseudonocardia kujensis]|uniref:purple acid phosphatase family protein n=1 Tax=Pseudonocardia kujensis TaxID=1128675 RepID=UPI001E584854|nr:metallophosphoesterase family protein [Pseudonocardia kujensis]MCE0766604.1 metallophosphoesterase family protein [Pseudonocardia kujensis]
MPVNPEGETPDLGIPRRLARDMTIADQHEWIRTELRRRPITRRAALRGGIGALAGLALAGGPWTGVARAAAETGLVGRHLAFGDDPRTSMAIAGELTRKPAGDVLLDLGLDERYGASVPVELRELVSQVPRGEDVRGGQQLFAHARAEGLTAGTTYHYRFRLPDGSTTPDATFRTAPAKGDRTPFTFTAFADQGVASEDGKGGDGKGGAAPPNALTALVAQDAPAFHLLAGDICYADRAGKGQRDDSFDPGLWTQYFAAIERSAASTPWMFATGNHDMEAVYDDGDSGHGYGGHAARLDLPRTGPSGCPSVYAFTHGCVGVVSVDANELSTEIRANTGYSHGAQVGWLTDTLATFRADPDITFVVVFFHHCAYSTSDSHASDGGVRSALAPLFDRFSVDLAVQGHNHQYERTDPIRDGQATREAPDRSTVRPATDGTTYLCVGSGGRRSNGWLDGGGDRYRGRGGADREIRSRVIGKDGDRSETVAWSRVRYAGYAYLRVEVQPEAPGRIATMRVHAITADGEEIDRVDLARPVPGVPAVPGAPAPAVPAGWTHTPTGLSVPAGSSPSSPFHSL